MGREKHRKSRQMQTFVRFMFVGSIDGAFTALLNSLGHAGENRAVRAIAPQ
jgi:hypothetical protein